jgi:hypothetical protein
MRSKKAAVFTGGEFGMTKGVMTILITEERIKKSETVYMDEGVRGRRILFIVIDS